jgi:hypothetical protein
VLDIFNNNAFGVTALTDAVNDMKYAPSRISDMGLFRDSRVTTTSISIERIGNTLQLVKPTPRGGPGETRDNPKRTMRSFPVPHFQRDWSVYADEVQGVRAMGSETALKTVQGTVGDRMSENLDDFALTEEHARLGAVTGIITYADGSTMNLFDEFGISQEAEINLDLPNAADGELRKTCVNIIRKSKRALGNIGFGHIHSFCDDEFFDALLKNPEFRATYEGWSDAKILRDSYIGKNRGENPIVEFGGIVFENYVADDDDKVKVSSGKAHFFPVGVPNLFRTYYAPADYIETVNTRGRRLYSKQWRMPNDKGINGEMQMNALQLCTRPGTLVKGKMAA